MIKISDPIIQFICIVKFSCIDSKFKKCLKLIDIDNFFTNCLQICALIVNRCADLYIKHDYVRLLNLYDPSQGETK